MSVSPIAMYGGTLFLEVTVPTSWPPETTVLVFSGAVRNAQIQIFVRPDRKLLFLVNSECDSDAYETPPLTLPSYPCLKVAFSWGQEHGIRCAINGALLCDETLEPIVLDCKSHPPTGFRDPVAFQIPTGCEDVEQSFLRFILDLQQRIAVNNRFDLLEASAILRRLLVDARPILHIVNRSYRERLRFPIATRDHELLYDQAGQKPEFDHVALSPTYADLNCIKYLTLDEFLCAPALFGFQRAFTVCEVIKVCANLKGGIHFGDPKSSLEESLIALDKDYAPFFIDASLASLPDIAWAAINGCRPLTEAILRRHERG